MPTSGRAGSAGASVCAADPEHVILRGAVTTVVFDVGETLVDETRLWEDWADALEVPRLTFMAVLGGVIARGEDHRRVFELVRPDASFEELLAERRARTNGSAPFGPDDLYPDALPCLRELRERGYRLGLAGNQ